MKFMISFRLAPEVRDAALNRFRETQGAPPAGVTMVSRWHPVSGNAGFVLADTSDAKALAEWVLRWSDLLSFDVTPVLDDAEVTEVLDRLG